MRVLGQWGLLFMANDDTICTVGSLVTDVIIFIYECKGGDYANEEW